MIQYTRHTLPNGLRVIVHEDQSTPLAAVNVCYYVGSRDESPNRTGLAHLFEHLMFSGTAAVPNFDEPLQEAGGENNAFTNNDITNFYDIVPAENLEIALWLESDRMANLHISRSAFATQRKVVIEEFYETCLNEPYGDIWHHLSALAYERHPYRWPTIGISPEHLKATTLAEARAFYQHFFHPANAVLVVAGPTPTAQVLELVEKWFGHLAAKEPVVRLLPTEPEQLVERVANIKAQVPGPALFWAFRMPSRLHPDFYAVDLLSDILGNGNASRLYKRLVHEQQLASFVDCYISGTIDPGLFILEAKPAEGVALEAVKQALWEELELVKNVPVSAEELERMKNKVESQLLFSEVSVLNKAINLAFFEILGNTELINQESHLYRQVTAAQMQNWANKLFQLKNLTEVSYEAENEAV